MDHHSSSQKAPLLPLEEEDEGPNNAKHKRSFWVLVFGRLYSYKREVCIALGPLSALMILVFARIDDTPEASNVHKQTKVAEMLAILTWVCIWWVTEAIPIAITSLLPLGLFPFFQIMEADTVAKSYMNDTITLFIGSFILALGVERYQVHKRLALKTLLFFGGQSMAPRMLLLGFCVGPAFISMWISNTATAIMMMPMSAGVLKRLLDPQETDLEQPQIQTDDHSIGIDIVGRTLKHERSREEAEVAHGAQQYARAVVLSIAFSVCIGGLTTITGTGTNLIFLAIWSSCFPNQPAVTYLQWFMFAFPLGLIMLAFCWLMLCVRYCPRSALSSVASRLNRSSIEDELKSLGRMSSAESSVLGLFMVLVLLWMTRSLGTSLGWGRLFHDYANDGTVSVLVAVFLFIIPNKIVPGEKLLNWSHCKKLPWDIVLLFGGGFSLAAGFKASGLSAWVNQYLSFLDEAPYLLLVPMVAIFVGITTEFTSNNATATIFLPLLADAAISNRLHPLLLMVSGTIAASFSFMLPISTPPMAVAFSTGHIRMGDMILTGFLLKSVGILLLFILMPTLGNYVFQLDKPFA